MIDQDITIRASVIKGNPNGVIEWQEVHTVTTDQFGLFTINVGEGNYVGGSQTNFKNIAWSNGAYWLRIEMDPVGGQNFSFMGATKIVSVPYALYAEGANHAAQADKAALAGKADTATVAQTTQTAAVANTALDDMDKDPLNELQSLQFVNDTLRLVNANGSVSPGAAIHLADNSTTNELQTLSLQNGVLSISNGNSVDFKLSLFSAPGADSDFPQGLLGIHLVFLNQLYTVPVGKILYITSGSTTIKLQGYGNPSIGYIEHPTTPNMPVLPAGTQFTDCFCTALLMDASPLITPIVIDLTSFPSYSVPAGKILFVKSGIPHDLPGRLIVDNQEMEFFRPNLTRGSRIVIFPENTLLKKPALYSEMVLTGYLIDAN